MNDESHLPIAEQSLVFRLRKRAEIRRNIKDRKSVQEGTPDRIADLLEEAAARIEQLEGVVTPWPLRKHVEVADGWKEGA